MTVKGKVVVITGASSGIGEAAAKLLAKNGAKVVLGARREDNLQRIVTEITEAGGSAIYQVTDVTKLEDVKALIGLAHEQFGNIDVLYNNAGLMPISQLADNKVSGWEKMIDVNIKGVLYGISAVLPYMISQHQGQIIATDSVAGHVSHPGTAVYAGTKFAVQAIMEGLRQEQIDNHIKTTMISPGNVLTELYKTTSDPKQQGQTKESEEKGLRADDIARAVLYAIDQPDDVAINEVLLRPRDQRI